MVVLAEGDPLFYSSYMYLHDRLAERYPSELVPGVTSISAAATAVATPLARHEDILTVLPGTLPVPELARRLADTDAAAIMKLGRTFPGVREALRQAGRLADAIYVERASTGDAAHAAGRRGRPGRRAVLLHDHRARTGPPDRQCGSGRLARRRAIVGRIVRRSRSTTASSSASAPVPIAG